MSMRYPGGLIATSPVNARYPSGVWTQAQAAPYQAQNVWTRDQFWPYTTLLLQGDGATNGAQNNTFLDSSSNNFTITRNGNTTQGSFTPYEQDGYWSNFFDGSGDQLNLSTSAISGVGSSNFSIECWVFASRQTNTFAQGLVSYGIAGNTSGTSYLSFQLSAAGNLAVAYAVGSSLTLSDPALFPINQWAHAVVCRSGSTLSLFVNGNRVATASTSATVGSSGDTLAIGGQWFANSADRQLQGYLSNVRIVNGASAYDATQATITVPSGPLQAITNTSLLTCQSNRFKDNSTNNFTLTRNGDTSVQAFQPFPGATTYSGAVLGGSGYFDGSGDFLATPSNVAFVLGSSGDFTVECWMYPIGTQSLYSTVVSTYTDFNSAGGYSNKWHLGYSSTTTLSWYDSSGNNSINSTNHPINSWSHVAVVRSGSTITMYVNGASVGTQTTNQSYTSQSPVQVGFVTNAAYFNGYISNVRVVKGSAVYTSNFTPPTAPLTAITNTSLLLSTTNAGIYDNSMMNNLETVGNAQVSTSVVKYGTGSMAFDGSGDGLYRPNTDLLNFGSGNFTIEFWINFSSKTGYQTIASMGYSPLGSGGNWIIQTGNGDGKLIFYRNNGVSSTAIATDAGPTVNNGQWYHIAIVKNGTTTTIYRDGVNVGSGSDSNSYSSTGVFYVGGGSDTGFNNYYFNGYLDDLRITKGAARYITNFTPPPARMPGQ